jgi:hypothetical protein
MGGVIPRFTMNTMFVRKIVQLMLREANSTYQRLVVSSLSFINLPDFPPYRWTNSNITDKYRYAVPGADPGFQVRGGALKKIAPSGGRREHFWGISCEKSRFYAKKSYFFQLRREARKFLGYFVWKITILRKKIIFFLILEGARAGWRICCIYTYQQFLVILKQSIWVDKTSRAPGFTIGYWWCPRCSFF